MKQYSILLVAIFSAAFVALAEPPSGSPQAVATAIGILPTFKQGQVVGSDERNPFGALAEVKPESVATGAEAAKITTILESLPLAGLSRDESGVVRCVLLGDLRLEAGALVPQLIEGQSDELIVQSLSDEEIVIAWRLEAGRTVTQSRILRRPIDLTPRVEVILPGQVSSALPGQVESRKSVRLARGKSGAAPTSIVPTSGLPPAKP